MVGTDQVISYGAIVEAEDYCRGPLGHAWLKVGQVISSSAGFHPHHNLNLSCTGRVSAHTGPIWPAEHVQGDHLHLIPVCLPH